METQIFVIDTPLKITLPETNVFSHLKMMVSNRNLLFQWVLFRCHVSFREGNGWNISSRRWMVPDHFPWTFYGWWLLVNQPLIFQGVLFVSSLRTLLVLRGLELLHHLHIVRFSSQDISNRNINHWHTVWWKKSGDHQLRLVGHIHPRWCRISSINSIVSSFFWPQKNTPNKNRWIWMIISPICHQPAFRWNIWL